MSGAVVRILQRGTAKIEKRKISNPEMKRVKSGSLNSLYHVWRLSSLPSKTPACSGVSEWNRAEYGRKDAEPTTTGQVEVSERARCMRTLVCPRKRIYKAQQMTSLYDTKTTQIGIGMKKTQDSSR